MKEHFNNGDWVYLVNADPYISDTVCESNHDYREGSDARNQLRDELKLGEKYKVRVHDGDHTLDIWYTDEEGKQEISEWFYAERFSKDNFLYRFKQIIDEG